MTAAGNRNPALQDYYPVIILQTATGERYELRVM